MTRKKVFIPYGNLFTIEKCLAFKQRNNTTTTEFALQVNRIQAIRDSEVDEFQKLTNTTKDKTSSITIEATDAMDITSATVLNQSN
jgi:hypothetical protein